MESTPTRTPSQIKHLEMIQAVVTRMASNSFQVKTWCVALVTALLGLASKEARGIVFIAYFPVLSFWWLDAFFLHQERLFRALFNQVRQQTPGIETDFSLDTRPHLAEVDQRGAVMRSHTLRLFYLLLLLVVTVVAIGLHFDRLRHWLGV